MISESSDEFKLANKSINSEIVFMRPNENEKKDSIKSGSIVKFTFCVFVTQNKAYPRRIFLSLGIWKEFRRKLPIFAIYNKVLNEALSQI